ncbi:serine/threonine-protein kinase [Amycolatopsis sp. NPDC059027]|uniref:serine/threonine-protein kinase n=1 Tax=Amycolatopsis sp. NPDC059027 TaxID=3346709 RepID=UPI0036723BBF
MHTGDVVGGRYRLDEHCGSGRTGVVWRAYDRRLRRTVALKRSHAPLHGTQRSLLRREAETAARISHPNAIAVFDVVNDDGCWLVMEYLPSESLAEILWRDGPLTPERTARVGRQIAAALSAAHAVGMLHGDVQPGTILVAEEDLAKLSDFGISVWQEVTLTADGKVGGTPGCLAPEVADGAPVSKASDVFSLGATLFAAVEGNSPWGDGDPAEVLARARRARIGEMHRAGPLAPLLSEMLAERPRKRPDAEQVWQRLVQATGEWSPPPVIQEPPRRPWWRRPGYWGIATAALALIVVLAYVIGGSSPGPTPSAAADAIGDPRTAAPCSLTDEGGLRRFGRTTVYESYGNFNRCDIEIAVGADKPVDVKTELNNARPPVPVRPGTFEVVANPGEDGKCVRRILVSAEHEVEVSAELDDPPPAVDLCAIADVATSAATERLHRGTLDRRDRPFAEGSLAMTDACALPTGDALSRLPGVNAHRPKPGFGNWECRWDSTLKKATLHILYDQHHSPNAADGRPIRLAGHDAFVEPGDYGPRSCVVRTVHRAFSDRRGDSKVELVLVAVTGEEGPGFDYCAIATAVSEAVATRLPR